MIYTELNAYDMKQILKTCDRDNFSIDALEGYLTFVEDLGVPSEFDPVGFDCSFTECKKTLDDLSDYLYLIDEDDYEDEDEKLEALLEAIEENTLIVWQDNNSLMFDYNF